MIQGSLTLFNTLTMSGFVSFAAGVDSSGAATIRITGAVSTQIQYLGALSGSIDLTFSTNYHKDDVAHTALGPGIIGRITLALQAGGIVPQTSIAAHIIVTVNSFAQDLPLETFITRYEASLLPGHGPGTISDPTDPAAGLLATKLMAGQTTAGAADQADFAFSTITIKQGLTITIRGRVVVANIVRLDGTFILEIAPTRLLISVDATMTLSPIGGVHVDGTLLIDQRGLVAELNASIGVDFGVAIGLKFNASGHVEINTTGSTVTLPNSHVIPAGFKFQIEGSVEFLTLASASGVVTIAIQGGNFTLEFDVTMHLAGLLDVRARGGAGIYGDANPGMALALDVSIDVSVFEIIKIEASGKLKLNTSTASRTLAGISIAAKSFRLTLNGTISILQVIKVSAGFDIIVGGNQTLPIGAGETASMQTIGTGEWVFSFHGSLDFFGIVTVTADGWINSKGWFNLAFDAGITLGSSSFGLQMGIHVHVYLDQNPTTHYYRFGVSASGGASLRAFGFTFASVGIGFSLTAEGAGRVPVTVSAHASISATSSCRSRSSWPGTQATGASRAGSRTSPAASST
jgi:hypothetical protein